jgi:hypothetical protein
MDTVKVVEQKLENGDLSGAIKVAIAEAEVATTIARDAIAELEERQAKLNKSADDFLAKYRTL